MNFHLSLSLAISILSACAVASEDGKRAIRVLKIDPCIEIFTDTTQVLLFNRAPVNPFQTYETPEGQKTYLDLIGPNLQRVFAEFSVLEKIWGTFAIFRKTEIGFVDNKIYSITPAIFRKFALSFAIMVKEKKVAIEFATASESEGPAGKAEIEMLGLEILNLIDESTEKVQTVFPLFEFREQRRLLKVSKMGERTHMRLQLVLDSSDKMLFFLKDLFPKRDQRPPFNPNNYLHAITWKILAALGNFRSDGEKTIGLSEAEMEKLFLAVYAYYVELNARATADPVTSGTNYSLFLRAQKEVVLLVSEIELLLNDHRIVVDDVKAGELLMLREFLRPLTEMTWESLVGEE